MRHGFVLAALLLPVSGCYVAPPGPGYGYVQPGYPPPGYPVAAYDPYGNVYPGYSYNDGAPTLFVDGAVMPLIFFGGGWGYYDSERHWHHAPDAVSRHLEERRASGATFRSGGEGYRQPRPGAGTEPYRGQSQYRPPEQTRPAVTQYSAPPRPPPPPAHEERKHECPQGQRC